MNSPRPYPIPDNEEARLARLEQYKILDTPAEDAFDRATRLASKIMGTPIALVSLVDRDRQWFKSRLGLDVPETPRDVAFCAHAIMTTDPLVVGDALQDERFADNPLVNEQPKIRFYAGAPLTTRDGFNIGTLCAIDMEPHAPTDSQIEALQDLAQMVVDELDLRATGRMALEDVARRKQLDELKSAFITSVNHELRTPLTSIIGSLKLLLSGAMEELPPQTTEMLAIANRNADHLLSLVNDLLDTAKLEAGAMTFEFQTLDLVALVREAVDNLHTYVVDKNLAIEVTPNQPDIPLLADKRGLLQVVINLLSNAIKVSPDQGRIHVTLTETNDQVRVDVTDEGPGLAKAELGRIFEKFMQGHATAKMGLKSTGLGLSISKSIVEAHGGTIFVTSPAGEGATFSVVLPVYLPLEDGEAET